MAPFLLVGLLLSAMVLGACRGSVKREPPIHLNWNMDAQERFDAQEPNEFFADGRGNRNFVDGTVQADDPIRAEDPCTLEFENSHLCTGKVEADGAFAATLPMDVSMALLERGKDRFEIFCTPCHDAAGTGNSAIKKRGSWPKDWPPPPSFHDARLRKLPVGQLYDIVRNGVRNMPAYGPQVPVNDRWAIAAYVRALQNSYNADLAQVPEDVRKAKGWK